MKRIRGFGDDALYKSTFYITLHYNRNKTGIRTLSASGVYSNDMLYKLTFTFISYYIIYMHNLSLSTFKRHLKIIFFSSY